MLAAWGVLEWVFAGAVVALVAVVGAFALFLLARLFVNPARRAHR